ncbi:MAG: hypothetical protein JXR07_01260 [Reichenbachiella sp.]
MLKFLTIIYLVSVLSISQNTTTVFLIGDSTMSVKENHKRPETGWGMLFATFFSQVSWLTIMQKMEEVLGLF